jgi:putative peptidoglycan lipid II flippase
MEKNKIYKNISKIAGSTIISRILGYLRDMVTAHYFGAGMISDAFCIAYRIPNLLRRLLGEGALVASFVPVYTQYLKQKTEEEQKEFLGTTLTVLGIVLVILTILGIIFSPELVKWFTPGFIDQPEKLRLAILLTRIMFPFFVAIGVSAFFMGILYVHNIFVYPALASCFLNISQIVFMLAVCPFMKNPIIGLAVGVVVGGVLQALFQLIPIVKEKIKIKLSFDLKNEGLRKVGFLMIPATIGVSVDQINAFVDMFFASWLKEGSVSALYYSNHLMQLPLAVFGIAVSSVSLPMLSKSAIYENYDVLKQQLMDNLNIMAYFIIPSSIGLIILSTPIVRLLFERGKFTAVGTMMSSSALEFYSIGIIAYSAVKILSTAYYSLKDTKTPVKIAGACLLSNVVLNWILMKYLQVGGLALATSISSLINASLLLYFLQKKIGNLGIKTNLNNFLKILISGILMGGVCLYFVKIFSNSKILSVIIPIFAGLIFYIFATYIFKVKEIHFIFDILKNKMRKK